MIRKEWDSIIYHHGLVMENTPSESCDCTAPAITLEYNGTQAEAKPPSPPSVPPPLSNYSHSFFAPELATKRKVFIEGLITTTILTIIVIWVNLSLYWGAFAHQRDFSKFLDARFIDQDGNDLGTAMRAAFQANIDARTNSKIGWVINNQAQSFSDDQVRNLVIEERAWGLVIGKYGATDALIKARENGDSSYNASAAVTFYYNQGRNENGANNYVVPYTEAILNTALANFSAYYTAEYFARQAGNVTAMRGVARAPQTICDVFSYSSLNLRPYTAPVAQSITIVGYIYVVIFAFILTMTSLQERLALKPFASFRQAVFYRILLPVLMYIPLSLSYAMLSLNTKVPFDSKYSYAGGFFLFLFYIFLGMCALACDATVQCAATVVPPRFMTFFIFPLILSNVAVAAIPIQLQPWFYRYGYGLPVYNLGQATRTIIFNTKSHLGLNAAVLLAWIALSLVVLPSLMWWEHRRH
ncbi:hypothetical protein BS47DRAFT_1411675 [Hydnum rufescens UP504]|uniref:DUF3533 domain-containing protein n=1 Tax=Hydnum rufescens UP504 TaxID=1448309 RepID=A0A9P6APR6_9AGAM|nr:hypothetical protein BS47DRAFT_1411675 [Hydnum rufescens UP504]